MNAARPSAAAEDGRWRIENRADGLGMHNLCSILDSRFSILNLRPRLCRAVFVRGHSPVSETSSHHERIIRT
jgi:hypothetical protein